VLPSWLDFSIAVGESGELAIAGSFSGSEDLDPSAGQRLFRAAGARDAFVTVMHHPDVALLAVQRCSLLGRRIITGVQYQ
jgi:hypothetical protein